VRETDNRSKNLSSEPSFKLAGSKTCVARETGEERKKQTNKQSEDKGIETELE
jgi:hypothetical protein